MTPTPPLVAVLDYGIGNLRSAQKALQKVGADARLTADVGLIRDAAGVVLPGVGAFGACMEAVRNAGLEDPALDAVDSGRPFLGVCVGMQLLYEGSDETPDVPGLGILRGTVRLLPDGVKRPQMQWNTLQVRRPSKLLADLPPEPWVYFVHSYAPEDTVDVVAMTEYGGEVAAVAERDNVAATQFHPEKSGVHGLRMLQTWVEAL